MNSAQDNVFPDGPPMPEMCEGLLGPDDIEQLFADLEALTTVRSVVQKGAAERYADQGVVSLDRAKESLVACDVAAVQIRYEYDGHEWTDTLMRQAAGYRLVRCQHPGAVSQ